MLQVVLQDVGHVLRFALGALTISVHGVQAAVGLQQQADHLHRVSMGAGFTFRPFNTDLYDIGLSQVLMQA